MRILVDTNIIISAMVFKSSAMGTLLKKIRDKHELYIMIQPAKGTCPQLYTKRRFELAKQSGLLSVCFASGGKASFCTMRVYHVVIN